MRDIYLSTYCVAFQDYPWLAGVHPYLPRLPCRCRICHQLDHTQF